MEGYSPLPPTPRRVSGWLPTRRACASVERTVAPNQAPGKTRSAAYLASPVSFSGPSRRNGRTGRARPGVGVPEGTTTGVSTTGVGGADGIVLIVTALSLRLGR